MVASTLPKKTTKKKVTKKTAKKVTTKRRTKKKTNLLRLHSLMNKEAEDAVDKEITRRFKTLIDSSEEDITKTKLDLVIKQANSVTIDEFSEGLQPYIKHYLFMVKRKSR